MSYLFPIKAGCCCCCNCRRSQPSHRKLTLSHEPDYMAANGIPMKPVRTHLLSCSRRERHRHTHSFLELHGGLMKTPVQVRQEGRARPCAAVKQRLPAHLFALSSSQGVTNLAATCSYSFILFPPRPMQSLAAAGSGASLQL